tara:strand:- start:2129 stop:3034 length:906 start_codon:yes stop_codon:yes gene_type:complete
LVGAIHGPIRKGVTALLLLFATGPTSAELPIVVQDDTGIKLVLSTPAKRIITLSPHLTEYLFHLGVDDQIVGAVEYSNYPAKAKLIPRIGSHQKFNLEAIIALGPDLALAWHSGNPTSELTRIDRLGIPIFRSEPRQLKHIANTLRRLGRLTGVEDHGHRLAKMFLADASTLKKQYNGRSPMRVFYQVWQDPLMTLNGKHLVSRLIRHCGGVNIFEHVDLLAPTVSREAVIGADPEIIIAAAPASMAHDWLISWRRWSGLRAVKNKHLFTIDPDLINRATPRILTGMQTLCELIQRARSGQ